MIKMNYATPPGGDFAKYVEQLTAQMQRAAAVPTEKYQQDDVFAPVSSLEGAHQSAAAAAPVATAYSRRPATRTGAPAAQAAASEKPQALAAVATPWIAKLITWGAILLLIAGFFGWHAAWFLLVILIAITGVILRARGVFNDGAWKQQLERAIREAQKTR